MDLTQEVLQKLGEAFSDEDVEFLPRAQSGGKAMALPYIDARSVMRRLDEVVGAGNWSFDFDVIAADGKMVRGRLTVCGVTKCDAGEAGTEEEPLKSAVSDALKRAAVHFGIGRYLYSLPRVWAAFDAQKRRFTEAPQISAAVIQRAVRLAVPGGGNGKPPAAPPRVNTETGEILDEPAPAPESTGDRDAQRRTPAPSAAGPDADKARGAFFADFNKLCPGVEGEKHEHLRHWIYGLLLNKERPVDPAGWPADYWQKLHEALHEAVASKTLGHIVGDAQSRAHDVFAETHPVQGKAA